MQFLPYKYQEEAISFVTSRNTSVLFLDMGLGKTVISLTAFLRLRAQGKVHKLLVVAPKRVAEVTWPDEIENWDHTKDLKYSVIKGDAQKRAKAAQADADVYIVSRDLLDKVVKENIAPPCDMLVVDEMQSFKSKEAARTKAMAAIREPYKYVVGLSGTPAPNGWLDLWSQYNIVDKGTTFGTEYWKFVHQHFMPGRRIIKFGREVTLNWVLRSGHAAMIEEAVKNNTLSMKAIDHLDLPGITFQTVYSVMDAKETQQYEDFAHNLEGYVGNECMKVPTDEALVGKLVQLANGTAYGADGKVVFFHDHKLEALSEILESAQSEGKTLLVAYWFKADMLRISEFLKKRGVKFADIDSEQNIALWNDGKLDVALIHPQKAGHGLNLQKGGATLVWYTLPWNLELYEQTNARLYRNGQTKHVNVVHIMTKNTIDGAIYGVLRRKRRQQDALFDATKSGNDSAAVKDPEHKTKTTASSVQQEPDLFSAYDESFVRSEINRYVYVPADENTVLPPVVKFVPTLWKSDDWGNDAASSF